MIHRCCRNKMLLPLATDTHVRVDGHERTPGEEKQHCFDKRGGREGGARSPKTFFFLKGLRRHSGTVMRQVSRYVDLWDLQSVARRFRRDKPATIGTWFSVVLFLSTMETLIFTIIRIAHFFAYTPRDGTCGEHSNSIIVTKTSSSSTCTVASSVD